jgi:prepilin-type N-terminal cleavage/methylation domain-containing protein
MKASACRRGGFTLIELLIVLAIVATLLTIAVPSYFASLDNARETSLRKSLSVMRGAIDQYYGGRRPGRNARREERRARQRQGRQRLCHLVGRPGAQRAASLIWACCSCWR